MAMATWLVTEPRPAGGTPPLRRVVCLGTRSGALAACSLAMASGLAWGAAASPGTVPAAAAPVANRTVAVPARRPPQTPRQFSEALLVILRHARAPSQCYPSYISIVEDYAAREAAVRTGAARTDAVQVRLAAHLRQMAGLLRLMAEQAKVREEIRFGRSRLPLGLRQQTYAEAGAQHRRLLGEFARMALVLPRSTLAPAPVSAPPSP